MINPWDDPWERVNPLAGLQQQLGLLPPQPRALTPDPVTGKVSLPPLAPADEDSFLSRVGGKTLSGLAYLGGVLDKTLGARAVRGLLGGHPEEIASILPGSDFFNLTDEKNRVSGKDLLTQAGVLDPHDDSLASTIGGIGTEIALSPATYLTLGAGALTPAGQAATKIGALPAGARAGIRGITALDAAQAAKAAEVGVTAADVLNKPLRGLVGVGLPFSQPATVLGAGPGGEKVLDVLGQVGGAVRNAPGIKQVGDMTGRLLEPVRRYGRALFDSRVMGATSPIGQQYAPQVVAAQEQGLNAVRGGQAALIRQAADQGVLDQPSLIRQMGELAGHQAGPHLPQEQAAIDVAQRLKGSYDPIRQESSALGFYPQELVDREADFVARGKTWMDKEARGSVGGGSAQLGNIDPARLGGRDPFLKNIPGGTELGVNPLSTDPEFSGIYGRYAPGNLQPGANAPTTPLQRAALIRAKYLHMDAADEAAMHQARAAKAAGTALTPEQVILADKYDQSLQLEDWAAHLDPRRADPTNPAPFFGNHVFDDAMAKQAAMVQQNSAGKVIHQMLADVAVDGTQAGPGMVPLESKVLQGLGFTDSQNASAYLNKLLQAGGKDWNKGLYVPREVLVDASRFLNGFSTPESIKPLLSAVDYVTNLTKAYQTALWPGFHVRNFMSGQWQNFILGSHDPTFAAADPRAWITPVLDAQKALRGQAVEGLRNLPLFQTAATDEEATRALMNLAYQYRATSGGVHGASDILGQTSQAEDFLHQIPGMQPFAGFGPTLKQGAVDLVRGGEGAANPLAVSGVGGRTRDAFAPLLAGRTIGTNVEDTNRLSAFIGMIRQGLHPEQAAMRVRAAHVDYNELAPFEKAVMRRLIPFYTYARKILPFALEDLIQHPGGLSGSLAQAAYSVRQGNDQFLPAWLGSGMALPLGQEKEGTQRFLTKFDTPIESGLDPFKNSLAGTALGLLGQTNPLFKGPLEFATGKQFFSGRDVQDLYPMTGNTLLDQAIMNSPISRFVTTGRQLLDERKGLGAKALNLGTGVRVSDVDMERARDLAARDLIKESLAGQEGIGRFETLFPRPGMLQSLTPEEVALLRLSKSLDQRAKVRAEQARQQGIGVAR